MSQGCPKQKSCATPKKWIEIDQNDAYANFGGLTCVEDEIKKLKSLVVSEATTVNDPEYEDCPTVALIGCRPSGMSFLHSLESRKMNEIRHRNTSISWPRVVCFEASSGHGGLWRRNESKQNGKWFTIWGQKTSP